MPARQTRKTATSKAESTTTSEAGETQPETQPEEAQADAPLTEEEWAKARAELIASLPPEDQRPKNIYGRIAQITSFVHQIRKSGWNSFHKYKYAKESDLVEAIRPILADYGIVFEHGLHWDREQRIVGVSRLTKTLKDRDKNITGTSEDITAVVVRTRFVWWNAEAQQLETTEWQFWAGYGDDAGDKGIYKALTGAVKYALMKQFLVSTGDDPEGDTSTDERAAARQASARQVTVERGGQQGRRPPAQGGKQENTTEPQRKVLRDLLKRAGAKDAKSIVEKLQKLLPGLEIKVDKEDYAGALVGFLDKAPGSALGTAIAKLRAELGEQVEAEASPIREEGTDATGDGAAEPAGTVDAVPADGWENEDKEGSDDAVADAEPTAAPDDGALTGDDASAV